MSQLRHTATCCPDQRCVCQMLTQVSFSFPNPTISFLPYAGRKCLQLIVMHPGRLPFQRQDCYNPGAAHPSETFKQTGQGDLLVSMHPNCFQLLPTDGPCEWYSWVCGISRWDGWAKAPALAMTVQPRISDQKTVILCRATISFQGNISQEVLWEPGKVSP